MRNFLVLRLLALLSVLTIFGSRAAEAISFDKFNNPLITVTAGGPGVNTSSGQVPGTPDSILGGIRQIQVATSALNNEFVSLSSGATTLSGNILSHSQTSQGTGRSRIIWDGNALPDLQPTGLQGLNLLADGATAFRFKVTSFDFPFPNLKISFIVYDFTDSTKTSTASMVLNHAVVSPNTETFDLPFSAMANTNGGADLTKVGAIELIIDGSNEPKYDLDMNFVGTNGKCDHVPVLGTGGYLVVDQCNVCNGNNATCTDCLGVVNGPDVAGKACSTGQLGVCGTGTFSGKFPNCKCNQDNPKTTEKCDQLDNDCDGEVDEGFDKGATCTAGLGACMVTGAKFCAPDGSIQCSAQATSVASIEICDGIDNDCNGIIDDGNPQTGPNVDQCGVCGGNGSSCIDCAGVKGGTMKADRCGVCGGDGTSCLDCKTKDLSPTLNALDAGAKEQETLVIKAIRALKLLPKGKKQKVFIEQTLARAHELQVQNWMLSWSVPVASLTCQNTVFCQSTSNLPILNSYRKNNAELRDLGLQALVALKAARGATNKNDQQLKRKILKQYEANDTLSQTVPEQQFACS